MKTRIAYVGAAALVAALIGQAPATRVQAKEVTVTVRANRLLNDTKIFVQAGDVVSFRAESQWTVKPAENVYCGPDGEPGTSAPKGYQLPGAPVGALVAVVLGKRYLVGSRAEITFENSGPLLLTANTRGKLSAYPGNKGTLKVRIEVKKRTAAGVNGRYRITFKENQVVLTSKNRKRVIRLDEIDKQKIKSQLGTEVPLPTDAARTLKDLSGITEVKVEKARILVRDAQNPKRPPRKGIYDPNKKEFLIHLEGKFKHLVGPCYFTYTKNIKGKFLPGAKGKDLEGNINLTLLLFCTGSQGKQGKGKAVTISLPFTGTRIR